MSDSIIVLNNIRSVFNIASIFRLAAGLGLKKIFLIGISPAPIDRFSRLRKDFAKVALGSEKNISWQQFKSLKDVCLFLKKNNYQIILIEQNFKSLDYKKFQLHSEKKYAFIFGNEVSGFSDEELKLADLILEIPLAGSKESLNVFSAAAIVLFRIFDN